VCSSDTTPVHGQETAYPSGDRSMPSTAERRHHRGV